ncbi:MAG: hypothetical protein ACOCY0_02195 [Roseicyclus sp.]
MSRAVLTGAAMVQCPHGVPATLAASGAKVLIEGAPVLLAGDRGTVAGCPFTLPPPKPSPCTATLHTGISAFVSSGGTPLLLQNPGDLAQSAEQVPQGPVIWGLVQSKVLAQ